VADVPSGLSVTPPQGTKKKTRQVTDTHTHAPNILYFELARKGSEWKGLNIALNEQDWGVGIDLSSSGYGSVLSSCRCHKRRRTSWPAERLLVFQV
jgi:hypothetical protein